MKVTHFSEVYYLVFKLIILKVALFLSVSFCTDFCSFSFRFVPLCVVCGVVDTNCLLLEFGNMLCGDVGCPMDFRQASHRSFLNAS